jgi:hypothetical protein
VLAEDAHLTLDRTWRSRLEGLNILQKFSASGPHVMYEGGAIHSNTALNVHRLFGDPSTLEALCRDLLNALPLATRRTIGLVVTHPPYGEPIARCFSHLLSCGYVTADAANVVQPLSLERDKQCLIVADEILSGGRMTSLLHKLAELSVPCAESVIALADFSPQSLRLTRQVVSAIREPIPLWPQASCPLCSQGSCAKRRIEL